MEQQLNLKYYCYSCQKHFFSKVESFSCLSCDSCAIEEMGGQEENINQGGRERFEVYEVCNERQSQQVLGTLQNVVTPQQGLPSFQSVIRDSVRLIQGTLTYNVDFSQNSYLFNMMRQLLGDGHTVHRATQQQMSKLDKIKFVKQCSICQSVQQMEEEMGKQIGNKTQEEGEGFKLKCNHTFHESCIKPWFQRANTCPVCRTKID